MADCTLCEYLMELYDRTQKTTRDYWLITQLFVALHDGDACTCGNQYPPTGERKKA